MSSVTLPVEIWIVILTQLKNPVPPPLSNPPRSAIQQPDLCCAARVSRLFKSICDTLLYKHVVTADFPLFLALLETPSKRRLLSEVRSLRIEYTVKGDDPTYLQLLRGHSDWGRCGIMSELVKEVLKHDVCVHEAAGQLRAWKTIETLTMDRVFPMLRSIAVASIFSKEKGLWARHRAAASASDIATNVAHCTSVFDNAISATNTLQYVCIRDTSGPLSINYGTRHTASSPKSLRTVHIDASDVHLPFSVGRPTRWIADVKPSEPWAPLIHHTGIALATIATLSGDLPESAAVDLKVFCSTNTLGILPPDSQFLCMAGFGMGTVGPPMMPYSIAGPPISARKQIYMAVATGNRAQQYLRLKHNSSDRVRWRTSEKAPVCEACTSGLAK